MIEGQLQGTRFALSSTADDPLGDDRPQDRRTPGVRSGARPPVVVLLPGIANIACARRGGTRGRRALGSTAKGRRGGSRAASAAKRAGIQAWRRAARDRRRAHRGRADVVRMQHARSPAIASTYTVLRLRSQEMVTVAGADAERERASSTTCWRRSASSRCWSARRCACAGPATRRRCISSGSRSRSSACLAFSFSGRLDTLDWVFYWGDVVAMLLLPPLFLHFALVFPTRPTPGRGATAGVVLPLIYLPALLLGLARIVACCARRARPGRYFATCWIARSRRAAVSRGQPGGLIDPRARCGACGR